MPEKTWGGWHFDFRNRKPARIKMPEKTWGGWHFDFPQPETCKDQNARENLGRLAF